MLTTTRQGVAKEEESMAEATIRDNGDVELVMNKEQAEYVYDILGECGGLLVDLIDPVTEALVCAGVKFVWGTGIAKDAYGDLYVALDDDPYYEKVVG